MFDILSLLSMFADLIVAYLALAALYFYVRHVRQSKSRYTIEFIEKLRIYQAASYNYRSGVREFQLMRERREYSSSQPELFDRLADLEALGLAVRRGLVDEELAKDYVGRAVVSAFRISKAEIYKLREASGHPEAYSDLEALAYRWSDIGDSYADK